MHIVFVTYNYPSSARPFYGAFVRNFIRAIAKTGIKCTVINPVSFFHRKYGALDPIVSWDVYVPTNPIEVRKPRYISTSSKKILLFNTEYLTHCNYYKAVAKTIKEIKQQPNILYGHFIYPSGAIAASLGSKLRITSIAAVGEDTEEEFIAKDRLFKSKWDIRQISGIVSVSQINKERCIEELQIPEYKIKIFPNGVDFSLFYPRNRMEMRKKYGFPLNKTIIAFTGHFEHRKGPNRVLEAVQDLDNIGVILIGAGSMKLANSKILFKGVLEHDKVPEMLSAADIFVLPTLSEGSCNAILEAMACGLPIISSFGEYNDDLLNEQVSIRINPMDISEISEAIAFLHENLNLRTKMSEAALQHVKNYDVDLRAQNILKWIREISN